LFTRFASLDRLSFWFDEANSADIAGEASWSAALVRIKGDVHPPGYYALLRTWAFLFGNGDFSLRSLSVLFSVLCIPLMFRLGSRFGSKAQGLGAALLFTLSPFQIYYAQEARPYAIFAFLAVWSFTLLVELSEPGRQSTKGAVTLGFVNAALVYFHYCAALLVAAQLPAAAIRMAELPPAERKGFFVRYTGSILLSVLLFLPWLPAFHEQYRAVRGTYWTPRPQWQDIFGTLGSFIICWASSHANTTKVFGLLIAAVLGFVLLQKPTAEKTDVRRRLRFDIAFLLTWLLGPILMAWAWSQGASSMYVDRIFIGSAPAAYLLIALLSGRASIPVIRWTVLPFAAILMLRMYPRLYTGNYREDWKGAVTVVQANASPTAAFFFESPAVAIPFRRYAGASPAGGRIDSASSAKEIWIIRALSNEPLARLVRKFRKENYHVKMKTHRTGIDVVQMVKKGG
jgi:uncharacterized membrane protein